MVLKTFHKSSTGPKITLLLIVEKSWITENYVFFQPDADGSFLESHVMHPYHHLRLKDLNISWPENVA